MYLNEMFWLNGDKAGLLWVYIYIYMYMCVYVSDPLEIRKVGVGYHILGGLHVMVRRIECKIQLPGTWPSSTIQGLCP